MEMSTDDQPPESIWLNNEALDAHFDQVKERYRTGSTRDEQEQVPLEQNELTKGIRDGR